MCIWDIKDSQQLLLLETKSPSLHMVYSILLTTKTEKAAQKCIGKEILNLSWKSAGRVGWVTVKDSNPNDLQHSNSSV